VDTAAKDSWVTLNVTVTNLSSQTRSSSDDLKFYLVLSSGELVSDDYSGLKSLGSMQLIKNGKGEATISFRIPKTQIASSLILIIRSPWMDFSNQDNHFALK
jgi:hypothetical protein